MTSWKQRSFCHKFYYPFPVSSLLQEKLQNKKYKSPEWLDFSKTKVNIENISEDKRPIAQRLLLCDLTAEFEWLKSFLAQANSPVMFCHNDLQEGNILVPEGAGASDDKVVFIDFEYCSYNYRGFDIANHFCEWCYDYSSSEYPHFMIKESDFPNVDQQLNFISSYIKNVELSNIPHEAALQAEVNTQEHILREVAYFTLASHFLWTLWSIVNAQNSQIQFGYWEYGKARLDAYFKCKEQLLNGITSEVDKK